MERWLASTTLNIPITSFTIPRNMYCQMEGKLTKKIPVIHSTSYQPLTNIFYLMERWLVLMILDIPSILLRSLRI